MSHIFPSFIFVAVVVFIKLNKILLLKIIIERVAPCFSLVPSQLELTVFVYERKLCSESSVLTTIAVNVVWMLPDQAL